MSAPMIQGGSAPAYPMAVTASVPSRGRGVLISCGPLLACALFIVAAVLVGEAMPALGALFVLAAVLAFLALPVVMWTLLLRRARDLERATQAWFAGDGAAVNAACVRTLATVFRGDLRAKALHLLGLAAEQQGDFARAADLFARAEAALPAMAAPVRKRHARMLMAAHRALCLIAAGRADEGGAELARATYELGQAGATGVLDALTDDASWGLGSISMNETLMKLEGGRPPRAVISLAWVLLHYARGALRESADVFERERAFLEPWLTARERALAIRVAGEAQKGLGPGPHRAHAVVDLPSDPWIDACVGGAARGRAPRLT